MADYPTTPFSAATRSAGQTIASAHINALQGEVTAIETALLSGGIAHHVFPSANNTYDLGTVSQQWRNVYVSGTLTVADQDIQSGPNTLFAYQVF